MPDTKDNPRTLDDVMQRESGAIQYPSGEIAIVNWSGSPGIPGLRDDYRHGRDVLANGMYLTEEGDDLSGYQECTAPEAAVRAMKTHAEDLSADDFSDDGYRAMRFPSLGVTVVTHQAWN